MGPLRYPNPVSSPAEVAGCDAVAAPSLIPPPDAVVAPSNPKPPPLNPNAEPSPFWQALMRTTRS